MDAPNAHSWPVRLVTKVGNVLRPPKSYSQDAVDKRARKDGERRKLQKVQPRPQGPDRQSDVNELGEREYSVFSDSTTVAEKPLDHTEMMHGLAHHESFESLLDGRKLGLLDALEDSSNLTGKDRILYEAMRSVKHENLIVSLPDEIWNRIAFFLTPLEAANLASSTKTLFRKLGTMPFETLKRPENRAHRIIFLRRFDRRLPDHLFCFVCVKFHQRLNPGEEVLKADFVANPIFKCPNVKKSVLPRMRLTFDREFPYSFLQLAVRAQKFSSAHGLGADKLSRRWKCKTSGWTHRTRYMVHDNRLLMRVVSQVVAPPAASSTETTYRQLLYDREEYVPYFSVCAHWRDGDLMKICKCALSHVPSPPDPIHKQLQRGFKVSREAARPNFIVRGCDECRPARRCPECATEYLVNVNMIEDTADLAQPFKHALVVTRWSDLGDDSGPTASLEWAATNGLRADGADGGKGEFRSFDNVGRRAVGGVFESAISGTVPGERLVSLNPRNKKMGEEGNG
ncbi:uncharacterized protein K489DRAFT_312922 [Dissoconium aciculare CBS 342.82]|uniref:F-box domain-containing protein n=1 Tax=Dissoconium aciculare CBS 342.82 TaxID=1314786 RepID=A0A6J3MFE7_9PEZI|nr:uncharacterized protein K489DRAFT_312922 [Dissoconium aciculare CBS 342.82]KAF1826568.1 hypothetical protein K489DRAFT_312922 [Dissoconium aciculare CBS 342.82]